jgi:hypothetical protein
VQQGNLNCYNQLLAAVFVYLMYLAAFAPFSAWAGPPFITDDPEPVDYRHGEFYISSQYAINKDGKEGTLPHFEFNYGAIPDLQLHLLVPLAFVHPNGGSTMYGLGDMEVGVKYRFIHESETTPQVGIFPIVHLPTGDSDRSLGGGTRAAVPPDLDSKEMGIMDNIRRRRLLDKSWWGEQEFLAVGLAGGARYHKVPHLGG